MPFCPKCGEVQGSSLCCAGTTAEVVQQALVPTLAEDFILALRFCYYVKAKPLIPDAMYDTIEKEFLARESTDAFTTPVNVVGSDIADSYTARVQALAIYLMMSHYNGKTKAH